MFRSIFFSILALFFLISCNNAGNLKVSSDELSISSDKRVLITEYDKGMYKIRQMNGITIYGKMVNGKLDGEVLINVNSLDDIKSTVKSLREVGGKKSYTLSDHILESNGSYDLMDASNSEITRFSMFQVRYKVNFSNGVPQGEGVASYYKGTSIKGRVYANIESNGYVNEIRIDGKASLFTPYGLAKIYLERGVVKSIDIISSKDDISCESDEVLINSFHFGVCLPAEVYKEKKKGYFDVVRRMLRSKKLKIESSLSNSMFIKSPQMTNEWKEYVQLTKSEVQKYYSHKKRYESSLVNKVFSMNAYSGVMKVDRMQKIKSIFLSKDIHVNSWDMTFIDAGDTGAKVFAKNNDSFDKNLLKFYLAIQEYHLLEEVVGTVVNELSKNRADIGAYVFNASHARSPYVDILGNIYIPQSFLSKKLDLDFMFLHESIHVNSSSSLDRILTNNLSKKSFSDVISVVSHGSNGRQFSSIAKKYLNDAYSSHEFSKDFEVENDLILMNIIKGDHFKMKSFVSMIKKYSHHDDGSRLDIIDYVYDYYAGRGDLLEISRRLSLKKVLSSYKVPVYKVEIAKNSFGEGTPSVSFHSVSSGFNIRGLNERGEAGVLKLISGNDWGYSDVNIFNKVYQGYYLKLDSKFMIGLKLGR